MTKGIGPGRKPRELPPVEVEQQPWTQPQPAPFPVTPRVGPYAVAPAAEDRPQVRSVIHRACNSWSGQDGTKWSGTNHFGASESVFWQEIKAFVCASNDVDSDEGVRKSEISSFGVEVGTPQQIADGIYEKVTEYADALGDGKSLSFRLGCYFTGDNGATRWAWATFVVSTKPLPVARGQRRGGEFSADAQALSEHSQRLQESARKDIELTQSSLRAAVSLTISQTTTSQALVLDLGKQLSEVWNDLRGAQQELAKANATIATLERELIEAKSNKSLRDQALAGIGDAFGKILPIVASTVVAGLVQKGVLPPGFMPELPEQRTEHSVRQITDEQKTAAVSIAEFIRQKELAAKSAS